MIHYTYWIIDHANGMYYHGVHSSDAPEDISAYHGSCKALNEAIRAHGIENFTKRVERVHATRELANEWEIRVHKRLNVASNPLFYNSINARPFLKTAPGPLSEKHKRRLFSAESRAKMAAAKRGTAFPKGDAWRKKVSDAKKGKALTPEHVSALKGVKKNLTDEQREHLRMNALSVQHAGTANHFRCAKGDGYIAWKIDDPMISYYVLNASAFARTVLGVSHSLTSKIAEIIAGKRTQVHGYTFRRPTSDEVEISKPALLETGRPYVIMSEV